MTQSQFDRFILAEHLIDYYTKDPIISAANFDIGPGWYDATAWLILDLVRLGWDREIRSIKTKNKQASFSTGKCNKAIIDRIKCYEHDTANICMFCGAMEDLSIGLMVHAKNQCAKCNLKL